MLRLLEIVVFYIITCMSIWMWSEVEGGPHSMRKLRSINKNSPTRSPQVDACPHLQKPPGSTTQLYFMRIGGTNRFCCGCPAGYKVAGLCSPGKLTTTYCEPCPSGTYITDMAHDRQTCTVDDLDCPEEMIKIASEFDSAPRCDCPSGRFKTDSGSCQPHTPCPPGEGVDYPGTPERDTTCRKCPTGYESSYSSSTDTCVLKSESNTPAAPIEENEGNTTNSFTTVVHALAKEAYIGLWDIVIISSSIAGILAFVLFVLAMIKIFQVERLAAARCRSLKRLPSRLYNSYLEKSRAFGSSRRQPDSTGATNQDSRASLLSPSLERENRQERNSPGVPILFAVQQPPSISEYHKTMNQLKLALCKSVSDEDTNMLYRHFSAITNPQQGAYLEDLRHNVRTGSERFCSVFEKLVETLGSDSFHPEAIHQYFETAFNRRLAEVVEPFLSDPSHS